MGKVIVTKHMDYTDYTPLESMNIAVKSTHIGQCMIEVTMRENEIGNGSIVNHSSIHNFAEIYRERNGISD